MQKCILLILNLLLLTSLNAQNDSLKKNRLSGFQIDIGPNMYPSFKTQNQTDYREYIKDDENLNADLRGYKMQWAYYYHVFNGLPGIKFYTDMNSRKGIKLELFFGLRYCEEYNTGAYYTKSRYDTLGFYTDNSGQRLYRVLQNESTYNFYIYSQKLIVPLGINFTTDKQRLFWITAGLEIAPAVNFNYVFQSTHSEHYEDMLIPEGDSIGSRHKYTRTLPGSGTGSTKKTKLEGTAYGFYAALPFTIYFHPFRKVRFLKHLNALVSISPTFFYSHSKYSGNAYILTSGLVTGIRYNW